MKYEPLIKALRDKYWDHVHDTVAEALKKLGMTEKEIKREVELHSL